MKPVQLVREVSWPDQGNSPEARDAPGLENTVCKMTAADPSLEGDRGMQDT